MVVRYGVTADAQFNRLMVLLLQGTLYNHSPTPPYDDQFLLCEACGCHKAFLKLALDLTLYAECGDISMNSLLGRQNDYGGCKQ